MESTLAQIYKERKEDGHFYGGPAHYASKGLGSRKLGVLAAVLLVLTFGIGFIGVQACNASAALSGAFDFDNNRLVFVLAIAALAAVILFKGLKAVARFSSNIVPAMALAWIVFCIVAICFNVDGVANAFGMIFECAFSAPSLMGGVIGTVIITGLKKGVFSNEAGLGSVANVASTADIPHPVKQGLIQSFGVLVDTLVAAPSPPSSSSPTAASATSWRSTSRAASWCRPSLRTPWAASPSTSSPCSCSSSRSPVSSATTR